MNWTKIKMSELMRQKTRRAEQRDADKPDCEKYAGRYGKSVKEWKADRKKDLSYKPQAPSASKQTQLKSRIKT